MLRQCWHSHVWGIDAAYNLAVRGDWVEIDDSQVPYNEVWIITNGSSPQKIVTAPYTGWKNFCGPLNEYLGVKPDGTLWGWKGTTTRYTLMDFLGGGQNVPVQIPGKYSQYIVYGAANARIINEDGDLFSWGCCWTTGNGSPSELSPVQIPGQWCELVRGSAVGAIKKDGTLWLWDNNCAAYSHLHGGTLSNGTPVKVPGGWCCAQGASPYVMFGIKANCALFTWGRYDSYGILGNGLYNSIQDSPTQIPGCWICVVAYNNAIYGIKHDCTLWGWGDKTGPDGSPRSSPTQIPGKWVEFAQTYLSNAVIAKQDDGKWYGWRNSARCFGVPTFNIPGKTCSDYFYCPTLLNPQFDKYYTDPQRTYFLNK